MDALDLRILRDIGIEPFAGASASPHPWRPEELAERLGESPRLVKDRIARLERDGVVAGYDVHPDMALLGLSWRAYAFGYTKRQDRLADLGAILRLPGVCAVVDYVTDWVTISIAFADDAEHQLRLEAVCAALGGLQPQTWFEFSNPKQRSKDLSRVDWRLLRALRGNARRALVEVAAEAKVSTKTAQRRLERMVKDGAFSVYVLLHEASLDELLICGLVVRVDLSDMTRLRAGMQDLHSRILADAWAHCSSPRGADGMHYDMVVAPRTPRALASLLDATAKTPGVLEVKVHLTSGIFWSSPWLDAQMDARIRSLE